MTIQQLLAQRQASYAGLIRLAEEEMARGRGDGPLATSTRIKELKAEAKAYADACRDVEALPDGFASDPRAVALAKCVAFALRSYKNAAVMDEATLRMETTHAWFTRVLREAGFLPAEEVKP